MNSPPAVPLRRVVLAALMPLVALAVQWQLWFLIKPFVWFLFFPAVLIAAWIGNRWSGLVASIVSVACVWWFFLPPVFSLDKPLNAYFFSAIFIAIGASFGEVHESLRRANRKARVALEAATEATNAEARAKESFQDLIEQAPDGVFVADRNGHYLDVNAAGCLMLGRRREDIIGRTIMDLIPPEDATRLKAARSEMLGGSVQTAEWTLVHADGRRVPVEISARTLSDGRWQVFVRDISERRRTEEQLRQAAIVFQSTNEAIIVTDAQARIVTVNSAFESMTGYGAHEVIGLNPRILQSGRQDAAFYRQMWSSLHETGQWQGELWDRRRNGEIFPAWQNISVIRDGGGQITHYAAVLSDISAIKHAEERLAHLAHHDALTGLPNRLHLDAVIENTIAHANRHKAKFALLFVDLDRFKLVNDTLGHQVGDQLLKAVAGRLRSAVRDEDTVARLGGDEFVVVLSGIEEAGDVIRVAEKIIGSMHDPVAIGDRELDISTSLGISLFPENGISGEDLLRAADTALYRAKERGRDTYEFYTAQMTTEAMERVSLENGLRRAIARGELSLHYQPQLVCATGALCGAEVLLRWQDPLAGAISPARFIPIAEESGLIDVLGAWVMDRAFAQIREWLDQGLNPPRVALNLSGRQILYGQVVETLRGLLERYRLDARSVSIEVEVTESVLQSTERCVDVLRGVRELGLKVAIDDFGTGYSSLGVLKQLPIDALKIDRMFTEGVPADADDAAITRAIVAMGHSLGLRVIAEGVERPEQLAFLKALGCDDVQGFLFARAMPAEEFAALLRSTAAGAADPTRFCAKPQARASVPHIG